MRVLLRRKRTGHYYRDTKQFASDVGQALDFASVPAAAEFALAKLLQEVEIVLRWDSQAHEITLPVLREWGELEETYRRQSSCRESPDSPSSLSP
jgi:hypothetical protein